MTGHAYRVIAAIVCLLAAGMVYQLVPPEGKLPAGVALFVLIGGLWLTQALPLAVTALLVPLVATLIGLAELGVALRSFANPIIFLFLGGFALAAALQHQGLDKAMALALLRLARGRRAIAIGLLFVQTAVLSMWISNTATAAMMLPLALGLLGTDNDDADQSGASAEKIFVLLGLAYSASIGGMATLVGSPPNAIAAAQAGISFAQWMVFALPLMVIMLPVMAGVLYLVLRPRLGGRIHVEQTRLEWTRERLSTVIIFGVTAAAWIASAPLGKMLGIAKDFDSVVALAAIFALVASGSIGWREIEKRTQWGVLLLFGGGLALSSMMSSSGASRYLAGLLVSGLEDAHIIVLMLAMVAFVVFLTELVSNTATAALLVPIFLGVSGVLGLPPSLMAVAIAISASCAFMLPVATPPNAIVFGSGFVPQTAMMRCGFGLNIASIIMITAFALLWWG